MLEALGKVSLLCLLAVEAALGLALFVLKTGGLISGSEQVEMSSVVGVSTLLKVVVTALRDFGEFLSLLLKLKQVVVGGLDALV